MNLLSERAIGTAIDKAEEELAARESNLGKDNPQLVDDILKLVELYELSRLYAKAELLIKRCLDLSTKSSEQAKVQICVQRLALIYRVQQKLDDAEAIYLRAVAVSEENHGNNSEPVADRLCYLAGLYFEKGEVDRCEELLERAISIYEQTIGKESTKFVLACLTMAVTAMRRNSGQGRGHEYLEKAQRGKTPSTATEVSEGVALIELIQQYIDQSRLEEATVLAHDGSTTELPTLWPGHPITADILQRRAEYFRAQGRFDDAERMFKKALAMREAALGMRDADVALTAMSLGSMYLAQGKYADAEPILKLALKIRVSVFGVEHPAVAAGVESYAALLRKTKRQNIATRLENRAREIRDRLVWLSDRANSVNKPA